MGNAISPRGDMPKNRVQRQMQGRTVSLILPPSAEADGTSFPGGDGAAEICAPWADFIPGSDNASCRRVKNRRFNMSEGNAGAAGVKTRIGGIGNERNGARNRHPR